MILLTFILFCFQFLGNDSCQPQTFHTSKNIKQLQRGEGQTFRLSDLKAWIFDKKWGGFVGLKEVALDDSNNIQNRIQQALPKQQGRPCFRSATKGANQKNNQSKGNYHFDYPIISVNKIYQKAMESKSKSFNFRQLFHFRSKLNESAQPERDLKAKEVKKIEMIEDLQQAERKIRLNIKLIEDRQHSKRFSRLAAHKRIKTEGAEETQPTQPIVKIANAVSIKKIDFYDNNEVQELNKRLNILISEKLAKLSKVLKFKQKETAAPQGDSNFYSDLNNLIKNIKKLKNKEGSNEITFLNRKIEYIESLMAENTTQLDLIKKYYYYCNSNKKRNAIGRFMSEGPRVFKAINQINRTSPVFSDSFSPKNRPFFGVASNKEQYKAPKKEFYQLERTKEQSYSFNDQPLPRSSYKRDFLKVNTIPIEPNKAKEDRHRSPNYTTTFKSRYALDFQPLKTQSIDYRELDAYQDKLKFLEISYPNHQPSLPLKPEPKALPSLCKESQSAQLIKLNASVSKQERCFDKHRFMTESQKSYGWQVLNQRSRIKHKQLREFQYRLKSLYKS